VEAPIPEFLGSGDEAAGKAPVREEEAF
jgi:hypothetical protein